MLKNPARVAVGLALGLFAIILACVNGGPAHSAPNGGRWGPDIRVNPRTTVTPDSQRNVTLAVNPVNPEEVVASYDSTDPSLTNSGFAVSTDRGQTWTGSRFYGPWSPTGNLIPFGNTSVAFDNQGTMYYTTRAVSDTNSGYMVLTSTNGLAWSTPVPIVTSGYNEYRDNGRLAVDPRSAGPQAGSLHFIFRYTTNRFLGIWARNSTDAGRTWSTDIPVSDPGHEFSAYPSLVDTGAGGLYAAFAFDVYNDVKLYLNHSTDGGATWGGDQLITGAPISKIGALDAEGYELLLPGDAYGRGVRVHNAPMVAVSPSDPRTVYAAWNDGRWDAPFTYFGNAGQHGDIAFSRSTDAGATWSAPVRVNDDPVGNGVDQFSPAIAVAPDGTIGLTWHDRRDDPAGYLYNIYLSESTDGGASWGANQRVSDVASNPVAINYGEGNGELGDYDGLVYGPGYILPAWIDTRAGTAQDVYVDRAATTAATPTSSPIPPAPTNTPSPEPRLTPTEAAPPSATPPATLPPTAPATLPPTAPPTAPPPPSATACSLRFADVPANAYYATPVAWLACRAVVSGYSCGGPGEPCDGAGDPYYRPFADTTRAQLSKLVAAGLGWPLLTPAAPTFADVPAGHPFYAFIETAAAHGVISGYTCGGAAEPCDALRRPYFRPYNQITRGQLAKIMVGAKGWPLLNPVQPTFADLSPGAAFYGAVETAVARGVLSGYDCGGTGEPCDPAGRPYFRPASNATRGQIAKILYNALTAP